MKSATLARAALLATSLLVSGCATVPRYLAWLFPHKSELTVRPLQTETPVVTADATDRIYGSAVKAIDARDYPYALELLQMARERSPQDVRVLNALGVTYDKLGRFDLSTRYYTQAEAAQPGSPVVAANVAYSHVLQHRYDDMQAPVLMAVAAPPPTIVNSAPRNVELAQLLPPSAARPVKPMLTRATPLLIGRPLMVVNASGSELAGGVRTQLAGLGWTVAPMIERAAPVHQTRIVYPAEYKAIALALANTLPFEATLSVCEDNCRGLKLVLGENARWAG